jgi:hypothetical protein
MKTGTTTKSVPKTMKTTIQTFPEFVISKIAEFAPVHSDTLTALRGLTEDAQELPYLLDEDGDELSRSGFSWFDVAEESWDDNCGISIHRLAPGVFVEIGTGFDCLRLEDSPQAVLSGWDLDNYGTQEDAFVAFGLDPEITAASAEDIGPFCVWVTHHFHIGHSNPPTDGWAEDDDSETLGFDTYQEAQDWISETESSNRGYASDTNPQGFYLLSHGEYAAPDFTICSR